MKVKHVLPYFVALLFLAWALGGLARSVSSGGGLLVNSYWLLYLLYLLPIVGIGSFVALIVIMIVEWKVLSDAIGLGLARRRGKTLAKQRRSVLWVIIPGTVWLLALFTLFYRCGGLHCNATNPQNATQAIVPIISQNGVPEPPVLPFSNAIVNLANFVTIDWYIWPFAALILVSSVIFARGFLVSMDETRQAKLLTARVQEEGVVAVRDAIRVLASEEGDPRTRIIQCYQRMIAAAASLGAPIGPYLTARELEAGLRKMFLLQGPGIGQLTRLFEEARYSLHEMTEADSQDAQQSLADIGQELKEAVTPEMASLEPSSVEA